MSSRFVPIEALVLSDAQRAVCDEVRAGRRGTVPLNVVAWLSSPELARRASRLGEFVRYETSLPPRLSELAILVVARHWSCGYEWAVHAVEAERAGVLPAVIEAVGRGEPPSLPAPDDLVLRTAEALVRHGRIPDPLYQAAFAALGETGLTELVGLVGYYTLVAFTLNARDVPSPAGAPRLPRAGAPLD